MSTDAYLCSAFGRLIHSDSPTLIDSHSGIGIALLADTGTGHTGQRRRSLGWPSANYDSVVAVAAAREDEESHRATTKREGPSELTHTVYYTSRVCTLVCSVLY